MNAYYTAGYQHGYEWIGPDGDGSMGSASDDFVREAAERNATGGFTFAELSVGPTRNEDEWALDYLDGFADGLTAARKAA